MLQITDGENVDEDNKTVVKYIHKLINKIQLYSFLVIKPSTYGEMLIKMIQAYKDRHTYDHLTLHLINKVDDWKDYFQEVFKGESNE